VRLGIEKRRVCSGGKHGGGGEGDRRIIEMIYGYFRMKGVRGRIGGHGVLSYIVE